MMNYPNLTFPMNSKPNFPNKNQVNLQGRVVNAPSQRH